MSQVATVRNRPFWFVMAAFVVSLLMVGCAPQLSEVKKERSEKDKLYLTFRNTGGDGDVIIKIIQRDKSWVFKTHFKAGEERELGLDMVGFSDILKYKQQTGPTTAFTEEERRNAQIPN